MPNKKITKIKFHTKGFKALLNQESVRSVIRQTVDEVAASANASIEGDGFESNVFQGNFGGGRPVGTVRARSFEARRAEAEDKVLTRAANAARGS